MVTSRDPVVPVHLLVPPLGQHREPRRFPIGRGSLTIGRAEACDVVLDVPGVDGEHARIERLLNGVVFIALGSDCSVGEVGVDMGAQRLVHAGDEILVGSVVLQLVEERPPMDTIDLVVGRLQQDGPRLRVVEGPNIGAELLLAEGKVYVIGRSPSCDLPLDDREVSREHLRVAVRDGRVVLEDVASTRGTFLGRTRLQAKKPLTWERLVMLRVGATVIALEQPEVLEKGARPRGSTPQPFSSTDAPSTAPATVVTAPLPKPDLSSVRPGAPAVVARASRPAPSEPPAAGRRPKPRAATSVNFALVGVVALLLVGGVLAAIFMLE